MIKSVTVTNFLDESLTLTLDNPEDGIYIESIDGLGPPQANVNITDISGIDGGQYNSARVGTRNVVLTLGFLEVPDIETVRHLTYKYFPLKKKLTLTIKTDYRTVSCDGYVEHNDPDIWSDTEKTQISIICPNPYLYSENETVIFNGIEPMFSFPYENVGDEPDTVFGEYKTNRSKTIEYTGDVDTGCIILIHCYDRVENLTIANRTTNEVMNINTEILARMFDTQIGFMAGDDILISTIRGDRYVTLYRDGLYYNIINCLTRGVSWITLVPGYNNVIYRAEIGEDNIVFRINSNTLYEGI